MWYIVRKRDLFSYQQLIKQETTRELWKKSFANEFGRLIKGVRSRMESGTETVEPIRLRDIPAYLEAV